MIHHCLNWSKYKIFSRHPTLIYWGDFKINIMWFVVNLWLNNFLVVIIKVIRCMIHNRHQRLSKLFFNLWSLTFLQQHYPSKCLIKSHIINVIIRMLNMYCVVNRCADSLFLRNRYIIFFHQFGVNLFSVLYGMAKVKKMNSL